MKRVVVTGMGLISPIGNSVEEFWENVKKKTVGIAPITYFDTAEYKAKVAAQVKNFEPGDYMDAKAARRMEPFCQYAVAAAGQAIKDSGLELTKEDTTRIGVCVSSGIGSMQAIEREYAKLLEKGPKRTNPMLIPLMISNMAAGNVSIAYGLRGKCTNVACATGTNSIGDAYRSIQTGEADVMVCGGAEAAVTPLSVAGFCALTALSSEEDPMKASLPFDKNRSGFVMGEGAGVVVIESLEHAVARGAHIYAEIVGYGATSDAYHITLPGLPRSRWIILMRTALRPMPMTFLKPAQSKKPLGMPHIR